MTSILKTYMEIIDKMSDILGAISMYLVIITVSIGFLNVVLRYVGQIIGVRLTSNFFIELQWYLYSLTFFTGFSYILKEGINVRVDFWFAEQTTKVKAWIDLVGHFVGLIPFCIIGIWMTINPVMISWGRQFDGSWGRMEWSPDPSGLPRAPIKSLIIVAFVTLLLQAIVEVIRLVATLRDNEELMPADLRGEALIRVE